MAVSPLLQSTRFLILALVATSTFALLAIAGLAGMDVRNVSHLEDQEVQEGVTLIEGAYQLKAAAIESVLAVRDYAFTGNQAYLVNATATSRLYELTLASIMHLDAHPEDAKQLVDLRDLEQQFNAFSLQLKYMKDHHLDRAAEELWVGAGNALVNRWVTQLNTMVERQNHHVQTAHRSVVQTENQIFYVLGGVSLVAIPLALVLGALAIWRFLGPLVELEQASKAIAGGQLDMRVSTRRDDEFGSVGRAFNTMADQVQASLEELRRANEALVKADKHKDEFLSMVSHELRTPLSFIKGFAGVLAGEMAGPLATEQRAYVDNIQRGADRMLVLVNDLLDLATIQAGKLTLHLDPTPIGPLVAETLTSLAPLASEKGVTLDALPTPGEAMPLDRARVIQVLTNLVANAIKFTAAGGSVTVAAMKTASGLRCEVRDTGVGIEPEDQLRLFQRFEQLDMGVTRKSGGTGLGLSICKALVEAHGGRIGVESTVGEGSTFWFELPGTLG